MAISANWYKKMGLEYASNSDPTTYGELKILGYFVDNEEVKITKQNKKSIDRLIESEIIRIDDGHIVSLTKKGIDLCENIKWRYTLPRLKKMRDLLVGKRYEYNLTQDKLSLKTDLNTGRIKKLEDRYEKLLCIDDVKCLIEFYNLDFDEIVEELSDKKKEYEVVETTDEDHFFRKTWEDENKVYFRTESPIETKLLKEILKYADEYEFGLETQSKFFSGGYYYRVDIYIEMKDENGKVKRSIIECDGHEFHNKTKEQVIRDNRRDRWFLNQGITTLRFSGAEISASPSDCAEEIFRIMTCQDSVRLEIG